MQHTVGGDCRVGVTEIADLLLVGDDIGGDCGGICCVLEILWVCMAECKHDDG